MNKNREYFLAQERLFFDYLQDNPATALEVAAANNLPIQNCCRYKRDFEKKGQLLVLEYRKCSISGFRAGVLTTNSFLIKQHKSRLPQLKLAI